MITNINCIKGVGKFSNCNSGGITFTNKVLIFGKNTHGKSTLTDIFSSLRNGNNDLIIGRKTFRFTNKQEVIIKAYGKEYIFQNSSWNDVLSNLEIFDTKFITDNVCNTENISFEQQQKLNGVILGDKGQKTLSQINDLTEQITKLGVQKRNLTSNFFNPIITSMISLEEFLELNENEDIGAEIEKKQKELEQTKNKSRLLEKIESSFFRFDFDKFQEEVNAEVNVNFKAIEEHIKKHFSDESKGEKFLQDGSVLCKSDSCPFCGQAFNEPAKALVESYKDVFSEAFIELQKKIVNAIKSFNTLNFEDKIKNECLEFEKLGLSMSLSDIEIKEFAELKNRFSQKLNKKKDDLTIDIDFTSDSDWTSIKSRFNETVVILDKEKSSLSEQKDIDLLEREFALLQLTKKRYEDEVVQKVEEYNSHSKSTEELQKQREAKNVELETYAKEIFEKYQEKINYFLKELNANFALDDFSHLKKLRGRNEFVFSLLFESSHKVGIYEYDQDKPNFKNTLSESDKRTLAFAFFLSKLSVDFDLDKKTIIFDDPISSFDRERKRKTSHLLLDVECEGKKPEQIIILTHQEDFLKDLARDLDRFQEKYLVLKIRSGNIELIEDIDREFPDDEIIDSLITLREILDEDDFEKDFFKDCRRILENIMKRKYYSKLKDTLTANPRASIRTYAKTVYDTSSQFYRNFVRLCDDLQVPLHDNSIPKPSDGDKKGILNDFFKILEGL